MQMLNAYAFHQHKVVTISNQDSMPKIENIPLLWEQDEFVSRYCGQKVTQAICTINELYKDLGYLFSLTSDSINNPYQKVSSFFSFEVNNNQCTVLYDIQKIETLLARPETFSSSEQSSKPSSLQMNVLRPFDNSVTYFRKMDFEWESTGQADQYLLELSMDMDFSTHYLSSIIFGTKCTLEDLPPNQMIYWRIKPLNFIHYCEEHRASGKTFASKTFVKPFSCHGISVNSLSPPRASSIFIHNPENHAYTLSIESMMESILCKVETNATQKIIDVSDYQPGAYFVYLSAGQFNNYSTLIIE